ncbi:hypothetical protein ACROYT_G040782 [Oculina patagonica]
MKHVPGPLQGGRRAMVDSWSADLLFSLQEVQRHNKVDDAWIVIDGKVYDVSSYVAAHPGEKAILRNAGGDSTQGFRQQAAHRVVKNHIASLLEKFYIGLLSAGEERCSETTEPT